MTGSALKARTWIALAVLLIVAVVAAFGSLLNPVETSAGYGAATSMLTVSFVAIVVIGEIVVIRQVALRIGWLLTLVGTFGSFFVFAERQSLALFDSGAVERATIVVTAGGIVFALFLLVLAVLFLMFPTGELSSPRWRLALWAAFGLNGALIVVSIWALQYVGDLGAYLRSNWDLNQAGSVVPEHVILASEAVTLAAGLAVVAGAASLTLRLRTARGIERQQVKWVVYTGAIAALGWTLALSAPLPPSVEIVPAGLGTLALTAGFAISLFRYRLYDIDRILSRTITYAIVVGLLGLAYAGVITAVTSLLPTQNALAVAASTLVAAALFNPLRKRIQNLVDRRFNRSGYEVEQITSLFAARLQGPLTTEELANVWATTVEEALQPELSGVWLRDVEAPGS